MSGSRYYSDSLAVLQRCLSCIQYILINGFWAGICRETKDCFLYNVPDKTTTTLLSFTKHCILSRTTVILGMWSSYNGIPNEQLTVNRSENYVDPQIGAHTQTIESFRASPNLRRIYGDPWCDCVRFIPI